MWLVLLKRSVLIGVQGVEDLNTLFISTHGDLCVDLTQGGVEIRLILSRGDRPRYDTLKSHLTNLTTHVTCIDEERIRM